MQQEAVHVAQERNVVYFYDAPSERVKAEHIFLNNFAPSPMIIGGKEYATVRATSSVAD